MTIVEAHKLFLHRQPWLNLSKPRPPWSSSQMSFSIHNQSLILFYFPFYFSFILFFFLRPRIPFFVWLFMFDFVGIVFGLRFQKWDFNLGFNGFLIWWRERGVNRGFLFFFLILERWWG